MILDIPETRALSAEILTRPCNYQSPGPLIVYLLETTTADSVASTLAAVLVLLDGTTPAANVIAFTLEITCMTAGTEWRVS